MHNEKYCLPEESASNCYGTGELSQVIILERFCIEKVHATLAWLAEIQESGRTVN